ncbi:hypothetical protein NDU88_002647 [Pleurodeles waltl]|uniref:Uncharacterized protein n=1 Tax=Pleurodeles waltl TaxID=8319 RepID=A0AAV7M330_PLEWA|nr:hypothetical protein NDU88_002647 [Pleurodeles waltl]
MRIASETLKAYPPLLQAMGGYWTTESKMAAAEEEAEEAQQESGVVSFPLLIQVPSSLEIITKNYNTHRSEYPEGHWQVAGKLRWTDELNSPGTPIAKHGMLEGVAC